MALARRQSGVPCRPPPLPAARHSDPANPHKSSYPYPGCLYLPGSQGTQRWKEPRSNCHPKRNPSRPITSRPVLAFDGETTKTRCRSVPTWHLAAPTEVCEDAVMHERKASGPETVIHVCCVGVRKYMRKRRRKPERDSKRDRVAAWWRLGARNFSFSQGPTIDYFKILQFREAKRA